MLKRLWPSLWPALMLLSPAAAYAQEVRLYISPAGDDRASGTADAPFRSLAQAQAAVRRANGKADVTVFLMDGVYRLDAPLRFIARDGGQNGHRVTWRAAPGAHPEISGGVPVTGWTLFDKQRNIYVADVPKGRDARQLWVNGVMADRAAVEIPIRDVEFSATGFTIKDPDFAWLGKVKDPGRLEMAFTNLFTVRFSPVASVDGLTFKMRQPAWDNNTWGYDTPTRLSLPDQAHMYIVNGLELMGRRHEWHLNRDQWYIDPAAGKLYYKPDPADDIAKLDIVLPRVEALVSISGTVDKPVENLSFSGLRFTHTSWMGPSAPTGYADQQSGAYLKEVADSRPPDAYCTCGRGCPEFETMRMRWSQIPAAVQVSAARGIVFDHDEFTQLGQIGLGIGTDDNANLSGTGLAAQDIVVRRNRFAVLAGGAILAGGVRESAHHPKDPRLVNRNILIENNIVTTVSQDFKDNAAIQTTFIDGAHILHNEVSDAPYDGIAIGWGWGYFDAGGNPNYARNNYGYRSWPRFETPTTLRDTIVAYNRIHGVKQLFFDGGAIYNLSANPGAVIHDNYVFDIGDRMGLYLDEGSKFVRVENNVVETNGNWLFANTSGDNYALGMTARNVARGNWHNSLKHRGAWLPQLGNLLQDNHHVPDKAWPEPARQVIAQAGVQPE